MDVHAHAGSRLLLTTKGVHLGAPVVQQLLDDIVAKLVGHEGHCLRLQFLVHLPSNSHCQLLKLDKWLRRTCSALSDCCMHRQAGRLCKGCSPIPASGHELNLTEVLQTGWQRSSFMSAQVIQLHNLVAGSCLLSVGAIGVLDDLLHGATAALVL